MEKEKEGRGGKEEAWPSCHIGPDSKAPIKPLNHSLFLELYQLDALTKRRLNTMNHDTLLIQKVLDLATSGMWNNLEVQRCVRDSLL